MSDEATLEGKVALITGAARGIGRAIALALARQGSVVVCGDVTGSPETAKLVRDEGGQAHDLELDVSRVDDVEAAMSFVQGIGGVDILVNNAGIFPRSPVLEMDEQDWDRVNGVNLRGAFLCARSAARTMRSNGRGGRIVNVTSGAAFVPTVQSAHYAASKAGLVAFTRVLALELAPYGVTVNAVAPGLTDTAQPRSFYSDEDLVAFAQRIPLGRLAQPADIAPAVLFLCGPGADYITGQTLHVNGGLFMP